MIKKTFTLAQLKSLDPSFDPAKYDRIPDDSQHLVSQYDPGFAGIRQGWADMQASARECIRQALEQRHGKPVISLDAYTNLRGLHPLKEFGGKNALEVWQAVQNHEIIVL